MFYAEDAEVRAQVDKMMHTLTSNKWTPEYAGEYGHRSRRPAC